MTTLPGAPTPFQRVHYFASVFLLFTPFTLCFRIIPVRPASTKEGGLLLLGNHVSAFDPMWAAFPLWRPCSFMASDGVFRIPIVGRIIRTNGAFPKTKFVKDRESMKTLTERFEAGNVVIMFPEGRRSWDGRAQSVGAGIGRLIKRLNAPVVIARNHTGHMVHPRWALMPRWVRVNIEYSERLQFDEELTAEEITDQIAKRIAINPEAPPPRFSYGFWLAKGLPDYLWACPSCFAPGALSVPKWRGSQVHCDACSAHWHLDVGCFLTRSDGSERISVATAHQRIDAHFGELPGHEQVDADRPILSGAATIQVIPKGQPMREVASGTLHLSPNGMTLTHEGDERWSLSYKETLSITIDVGSTLRVRTQEAFFQINLDHDSALRWQHYMSRWKAHFDAQNADQS